MISLQYKLKKNYIHSKMFWKKAKKKKKFTKPKLHILGEKKI